MKLSDRLSTVASFVSKGSIVADIGTDHGYIPIFLVEQQIARSAIAMDVRKGPLERAKAHIKSYGLEGEIEVRLSDGLNALTPGEADTVVAAGMGGDLIIHILETGRHIWDTVGDWILSPQSDLYKVRLYLEQQGFAIEDETMVYDDGKYYTVMLVHRGSMEYQKASYYQYGRCLIEKRHPVLQEYLTKEAKKLEAVLNQVSKNNTQAAAVRLAELRMELERIKEAEDEMQ